MEGDGKNLNDQMLSVSRFYIITIQKHRIFNLFSIKLELQSLEKG